MRTVQKTAPTKRHTIIKQFQGDKSAGAQAICVTYSVAAVGITLTSASRVYLFEPCLDPGQEQQAAGRVHRLGQDKNVFIRRLAFRDTVEEMVVDVQGEVKAGRLKEFEYVQVLGLIVKRPVMTDEVKTIMRKHGLDKPHKASSDQKLYKFANFAPCSCCGRKCRAVDCKPADTADGGGSSSDDGNASGAGGSCAVA